MLLGAVPRRSRRHVHTRPFVDRVKVLLSSGAGGDGASIMGSVYNNEFAGPVGGNGGRGGNLFVQSQKVLTDLSHIERCGAQIVAEPGRTGRTDSATGRGGRGTTILVPLGTQIVDVDTNEVVIDLDEDDVKFLLLEGGQGGKGNKNFISAMNHSPKESTRGLPGNTMLAQFELKTIADCGLVGLPNSGKSSILSAVSSSKPKVASYPFTTLQPFVGHVHDLLGNSCLIADTPGLIEGAFENRGLGHQFLRHLERTSSLAYVLDMHATHSMGDGDGPSEPWDVLEVLENELELYLPGLSERAIMIFANKCDYEKDVNGTAISDKLEELRRRTHLPVFAVSAKTAIEHGPYHPVAALGDPLQFMCNHVFAEKARERGMRADSKKSLDSELDSIFRGRHRAHFAPVDFSQWRSSVIRKGGASLSSFSSGGETSSSLLSAIDIDEIDEDNGGGELVLGPSPATSSGVSEKDPTLASPPPESESFAERAARLRKKFSQPRVTSSSLSQQTHTKASAFPSILPPSRGPTPKIKMPVIEDEMSLVDQQLGGDISGGEVGVGDRYDSYKHLPERAKLQRLRDTSLKGRVWQRTRTPGERLKDETWSA